MDKVVDHIKVPTLPSELLILQQNTVKLKIEHSSYLSLYLFGSSHGEVIVIGRVFPRVASCAGSANRQEDTKVSSNNIRLIGMPA